MSKINVDDRVQRIMAATQPVQAACRSVAAGYRRLAPDALETHGDSISADLCFIAVTMSFYDQSSAAISIAMASSMYSSLDWSRRQRAEDLNRKLASNRAKMNGSTIEIIRRSKRSRPAVWKTTLHALGGVQAKV